MHTRKKPEFIVTATHPVLTEEERAKQMERIKKAAVELVLASERNRKGAMSK